jgi:hypothetical protein
VVKNKWTDYQGKIKLYTNLDTIEVIFYNFYFIYFIVSIKWDYQELSEIQVSTTQAHFQRHSGQWPESTWPLAWITKSFQANLPRLLRQISKSLPCFCQCLAMFALSLWYPPLSYLCLLLHNFDLREKKNKRCQQLHYSTTKKRLLPFFVWDCFKCTRQLHTITLFLKIKGNLFVPPFRIEICTPKIIFSWKKSFRSWNHRRNLDETDGEKETWAWNM